MIRESLSEYISKNTKTKQQANLILEADDEKEILSISCFTNTIARQ